PARTGRAAMQEKPRSAIMTARLGIQRTIAEAAARKLCGVRAATACFTASPLIKTALFPSGCA
ncbi:MAG: hypothetical protein V3T60_01565, partial [Candidatus Binatia bacterium]